ncbi:MAG: PSD1 and planctomycete cytochrome C domain-containing protein [Planctomycetota bacterium]
MTDFPRLFAAAVFTLVTTGAIHAPYAHSQQSPSVDFQRQIRPILSNHCFPCHGADETSRQADLRLDIQQAAMRSAILPGKATDSPLMQRITATDPDVIMPPPDSGKPLTTDQIQLLRAWINAGAEYQQHWAFVPIRPPELTRQHSDAWCRNPIDGFILERLRQEGLEPSPEADRGMLIRRLYQDLLGLLPSPEETAVFLADPAPDAWEQRVDRVLQSPHYGERWGRHWLDQARYADSNGYTIDGPRVMWPWRDWVINAFNSDLPFDQFTIEQLAGDLLESPTLAQRIATGFHRNTMINEEGGVKPDQFRNEAVIDRVNTTGAVWLGLTVGCAQCHSHKYDPISHTDYYRLYAFFNGAADANSVGETVDVREQELLGWTEQQQQQLAELQQLRVLRQQLETSAQPGATLPGLAWNWQTVPVAAVGASGSSILRIQPDGSLLAKTHASATDTFTVRLQLPPVPGGPVSVTGIRLRTLLTPALPAMGPGTAANGNFVLTEVLLRSGPADYPFAAAWADHSQPLYPIEHAIDGKSDTGWAINTDAAQKARGIQMNAPHQAILALPKPVTADDGFVTVVLRHDLNKNYLLGHFAIDLSTADVFRIDPPGSLSSRLQAAVARISELESQLPGKGQPVKQMVMKDLPQHPETFLLTRGDFLTPDRDRGPLQPGVPAALDPAAHTKPFTSRLDLARWLVTPDHPLTARVLVNRVWSRYFGRGLVETENDFGFQGTAPTHPQLLDWLAADLIEHHWSLKHLHRRILTSALYRQTSALVNAPAIHQDPHNYLLARQPRFRVEAEIVRDQALAASGLLNRRIGGPGVHLPQPDGIYDFTQNRKNWPVAVGPDRWRRTMYVMFYRSAPYPLLTTFDAPDFSTVCTRRVRSNTPLQSLTAANDVVFTELASGTAQRVLTQPTATSDADRLTLLFQLCLSRVPSTDEQHLLLDFLSRELARFHSSPDAALAFIQQPVDSIPVETLAAWTSVARALMNTDEFVTRN